MTRKRMTTLAAASAVALALAATTSVLNPATAGQANGEMCAPTTTSMIQANTWAATPKATTLQAPFESAPQYGQKILATGYMLAASAKGFFSNTAMIKDASGTLGHTKDPANATASSVVVQQDQAADLAKAVALMQPVMKKTIDPNKAASHTWAGGLIGQPSAPAFVNAIIAKAAAGAAHPRAM